jgi:hypothetical protein
VKIKFKTRRVVGLLVLAGCLSAGIPAGMAPFLAEQACLAVGCE